jgi:uncharacterized small protein (DUF1192 family)
MKLIVLLLIVSCASPQTPKLEKPVDYSEVIKTVEKAEIKPVLKAKIVNTIKEQSSYSNACYDKVLEIEERLNKLEAENERLKADNAQLKDELGTWRAIKAWFWVGVVLIVLVGLIRLFYPILAPIAKRALGIPV